MSLAALAPFRIRSYRFQWPADLLTSCAFEMETLILGWYVLVETSSVIMLTIFGAMYYGGTLIAPMLGVASDRIGHRTLLSGMRVIYAAVAATLTALAFAGMISPILACVMAAITGLVRPSDMGLRGALIAETMPTDRLIGAMGLSRTTGDTARVGGALTGAGLFAAFGFGPAYVAITIFYALAALLTWYAAPGRDAPSHPVEIVPSASPWRDLREGFVHVWNTPRLLALVWMAFVYNFTAFALTQGLMPYVARDIFHTDQTGLGYLVASLACGALAGALILGSSRLADHLPRLMLCSAVVWHALLIVFAQMESMVWGMVLLLLIGVAQSFSMVSHTVILLRASGRRFRGRVTGVRMLAIYSLPLGLLGAGVLVGRIGYDATVTIYATIGIVCTALTAMLWYKALADPHFPDEGRVSPPSSEQAWPTDR